MGFRLLVSALPSQPLSPWPCASCCPPLVWWTQLSHWFHWCVPFSCVSTALSANCWVTTGPYKERLFYEHSFEGLWARVHMRACESRCSHAASHPKRWEDSLRCRSSPLTSSELRYLNVSYTRLAGLWPSEALSCLHLPPCCRSPGITDLYYKAQLCMGSGGQAQVLRLVWRVP